MTPVHSSHARYGRQQLGLGEIGDVKNVVAPAAGTVFDIERLAERLRGQLGAADAARLAALL